LVGNKDVEDSLQRLDKLTHEEAQMAAAELLKVVHRVDDRIEVVHGDMREIGNMAQNGMQGISNAVNGISGDVRDISGA